MITPIQASIIKDVLSQGNSPEFIEALLLEYASDVEKTSQLLSMIPKIAEKRLQITQNHAREYSTAVNLMIGECTRKNHNTGFPTLLYTSKAFFPRGNCDGGSPANKIFFGELIEAIKNKTGFDYECGNDWNWLCNIAQCREWMISVIKQNIDENFEEPKVQNDDS